MKILYITPYPPLKTGVADYAKEYSETVQGFASIEVFNSEIQNKKYRNSKNNINREKKDLRKKIDSTNFDLIHIELAGGTTREFYLGLEAVDNFPETPVVLTIHDPPRLVNSAFSFYWLRNTKFLRKIVTFLTFPFTKRLEDILIKRSKTVIVFSKIGKESLVKRFGKKFGKKIRIIPHGIYKKDSLVPKRPKKEINLLCFGFIYRGKGIEILLEGFKELVFKLPNNKLELFLVGAGAYELSKENIEYEDYIKELVNKLGIADRVNFMGYIEELSIGDLFSKMDIMIIPYQPSSKLSELLYGKNCATSGAMIKGLSYGLPIIVSNARALPEEVEESKAGLIFDFFNPDNLAEKVSQSVKNNLLPEFNKNAIKHIVKVHDWQRVKPKLKNLYKKILEDK